VNAKRGFGFGAGLARIAVSVVIFGERGMRRGARRIDRRGMAKFGFGFGGESVGHKFFAELEVITRMGAGIGADKASPLFRTLGGRGRKQLTELRMAQQDARRMIVRRALAAGIITRLGCHTFRATGITVYLLNGGHAQQMAAHESAQTTKLYDRRNDLVTLDQVERIVL